jgi:hypothetical protein
MAPNSEASIYDVTTDEFQPAVKSIIDLTADDEDNDGIIIVENINGIIDLAIDE